MRIARFGLPGREGWGFVVGDGVVEGPSVGLPGSLDSLLGGNAAASLAGARASLAAARPSLRLPEVALRAPVRPSKIVCVGLNYADHAAETGAKIPKEPVLFAKLPNAVAGPRDDIRCPGFVERLDYEAELGVVIGARCRDIEPSRAMEQVLGYVAVNDLSARDLQARDGQWTRAKSLDTFCPVGPWLVTADEIPDPHRLAVRARVNGEVRQDSSTASMVVKLPELIAYISRGMTLEPGDLISTGTPAGVGMGRRPPVFLKEGDVVEVEVGGVGALRNRVRREGG
ncbi:MAG: fumarylacetoacetate hydrolase family protein [Halobacteria archaeon]